MRCGRLWVKSAWCIVEWVSERGRAPPWFAFREQLPCAGSSVRLYHCTSRSLFTIILLLFFNSQSRGALYNLQLSWHLQQ